VALCRPLTDSGEGAVDVLEQLAADADPLAAVDASTGQLIAERESPRESKGTSKRCAGHTASTESSPERSRIAVISPTISSKRSSPPASESCGLHRS
jgi:hypothetical protein